MSALSSSSPSPDPAALAATAAAAAAAASPAVGTGASPAVVGTPGTGTGAGAAGSSGATGGHPIAPPIAPPVGRTTSAIDPSDGSVYPLNKGNTHGTLNISGTKYHVFTVLNGKRVDLTTLDVRNLTKPQQEHVKRILDNLTAVVKTTLDNDRGLKNFKTMTITNLATHSIKGSYSDSAGVKKALDFSSSLPKIMATAKTAIEEIRASYSYFNSNRDFADQLPQEYHLVREDALADHVATGSSPPVTPSATGTTSPTHGAAAGSAGSSRKRRSHSARTSSSSSSAASGSSASSSTVTGSGSSARASTRPVDQRSPPTPVEDWDDYARTQARAKPEPAKPGFLKNIWNSVTGRSSSSKTSSSPASAGSSGASTPVSSSSRSFASRNLSDDELEDGLDPASFSPPPSPSRGSRQQNSSPTPSSAPITPRGGPTSSSGAAGSSSPAAASSSSAASSPGVSGSSAQASQTPSPRSAPAASAAASSGAAAVTPPVNKTKTLPLTPAETVLLTHYNEEFGLSVDVDALNTLIKTIINDIDEGKLHLGDGPKDTIKRTLESYARTTKLEEKKHELKEFLKHLKLHKDNAL